MPLYGPLSLGLLPEKKLDWRTFVFSYTASCVLILLLLVARLIWPDRLTVLHHYAVVELVSRPELKPPPPPPARPKIPHITPVVPIATPKLIVPREIAHPKPEEVKLQPPRLQPAHFDAPKLPAAKAMPKFLYVGSFSNSSPQPAPVNHVNENPKVAGFADPAQPPTRTPKLTAATLGSFDESAQGSRPLRNGVQAGAPRSAGFGDSSAAVGHSQGSRSTGQVQTAGFAAQPVRTGSARRVADEQRALTTQVEILFKPNPVYTEEARKLNLEGEVLLEVEFLASGELHVKRVVRGLGHGLDEAAVAAATKIKFKPAQQNGTPVDSTAIVHVSFQLAS